MTYRTIVADPPWMPDLGGTWGARVDKGRPQRFYNTMSLHNIASLTVPAAKQAHLYLWCLAQHVDWGYQVARAWGFDPVILFTWEKPGLGVGRFRCTTEHFLVARKGSRHGNPFGAGGRNAQATAGTCARWPRGAHSVKPAEFYDLVQSLSPGPYLEMFARCAERTGDILPGTCQCSHHRLGWDTWGNEAVADVEIA